MNYLKRLSKILLLVLVITTLTMALTACGGSKETPGNGDYKDGTYIGQSEREFGMKKQKSQ